MRILGIDPGLAIMGWGVVDAAGGDARYVAHGTVKTTPDTSFPQRLILLDQGMRALCDEYRPDEIAFEELFFARNVTTALLVGAARGIAVAAACRATDQLFEYTPMQVKQAITGYGKADKKQIQQMVKLLLRLRETPQPDDAADALAIALTHAHSMHSRELFRMK